MLRWVCGGVGGLLIGFVVCVRGGGGLSQAITVGGCFWLWWWCEFFFFCWLSLGFFVARFVSLLNFGCFYVLFWLVFEMIL